MKHIVSGKKKKKIYIYISKLNELGITEHEK